MAVIAIAAFSLRPAAGPSTMEVAASPSPMACTGTLLQGGKNYVAEAVDPTGRYIAGSDHASSVMLWDNGTPRIIPLPAGLTNVQVAAVNSRGVVLGGASDAADKPFPWIYRDGKIAKQPNVEGEEFYGGGDINTAGDVVGATAKSEEHPTRAVIWPVDGPPRILAAPATKHGATADVIGDDGTIAGNIGDGEHPYVWGSDGVVRDLDENPVRTGGEVNALSGDWAAGWVSSDEGPGARMTSTGLIAAVWNIRTGELVQYRDLVSPAVGVTVDGDIVTNDGVLVTNGKQSQLPKIVQPGSKPGDVWVAGMSRDGKTIVGGSDGAAVWRC